MKQITVEQLVASSICTSFGEARRIVKDVNTSKKCRAKIESKLNERRTTV